MSSPIINLEILLTDDMPELGAVWSPKHFQQFYTPAGESKLVCPWAPRKAASPKVFRPSTGVIRNLSFQLMSVEKD